MPITPPPPTGAIRSIDQFGLRPASPRGRPASPSARDPNWTLGSAAIAPLSLHTTGSAIADTRANIPGTRTALTKFAMRNQRIVADPFPDAPHCPRRGAVHRNPILLGAADPFEGKRPSDRGAATHAVSIISERVSYDTVGQRYRTRQVPAPDPSDLGLASHHSCFGVDASRNSTREWNTSHLSVLDEPKDAASIRSQRASSGHTRQQSPKTDVAALREINYPRLGTPREAVVTRRQSPRARTPQQAHRPKICRPAPVPVVPEWWG